MNMKSHHQTPFFDAISQESALEVIYYGNVDQRRKSQGWTQSSLDSKEYLSRNFFYMLYHLFRNKDFIHVFPGYGNFKIFLLCVISSFFNIKWVHWSEAERNRNKGILKRSIVRVYGTLVQKYSSGCFGVSLEAINDFVLWGVESSKCHLLTYSVKPVEFFPVKNIDQDGVLNILFVGELCTRKGFDLIMSAVEILQSQQFRLNIVGKNSLGGSVDSWMSKNDNVNYLGVVDSSQVSDIIRSVDCLILPSRFDGWGMAGHEAVALGKPVITTNKCGVSNLVVVDGVNGFVIDPDAEQLIQALVKMRNDSVLHEFSINCRKIAEEFSPRTNTSRLLRSIRGYENQCGKE